MKNAYRTMSIVPTLFLGVEYCATFQAALYIETHSLMHQSEFHAASVTLSRAADKRKSLINIHKNGYSTGVKGRNSRDLLQPRSGKTRRCDQYTWLLEPCIVIAAASCL